MPLIDLQTDLKSLKFGGDRLNGGDSPQPFIKVPIPPQDSDFVPIVPASLGQGVLGLGNGPGIAALSGFLDNTIGNIRNSPFFQTLGSNDVIIRGGTSSITRSAIDAVRITRFLLSDVKGPLFVSKQEMLSNSGVRTQGSGVLNEGNYFLGVSAVGQSAGNAFGLHLLKQNKNLNILAGEKNAPTPDRYLDNADPKRNNNLTTSIPEESEGFLGGPFNPNRLIPNRLVALKEAIDSNTTVDINGIRLNGANGTLIADYPGGPNSNILGGSTYIKFADPFQRTGANNPNLINSGFFGSDFQPTSGVTFNLGPVADGVSMFVNSQIDRLSNRRGVAGFFGNALAAVVPALLDTGFNRLEEFVQTNIDNALGFERLPALSNFTVFRRPSPIFNFNNYVRLSNIFGSFISDPVSFNDRFNEIRSNGDRGTTFDFNVYQGNGDITVTNPELQNRNGGASWTQKNILEAPTIATIGEIGNDFRKVITRERGEENVKTVISNSPEYRRQNFNLRVDAGDPGQIPVNDDNSAVFNYGVAASTLKAVDRLNALEGYQTSNGRGLPDYSKPVKDLVKLRFALVPYSDATKPVYLHFRSYLNSFDDSYTGNWNEVKYVGRGDSLYNYEGFNRTINFGFTVAAISKAELIPMYRKLNQLASTVTPSYSSDAYMRGQLIKFTMGGYIYETPGFLTSLQYSIPQEAPFEIAINENGDTDDSVKELSKIINVTATFQPIHDFLPRRVFTSGKNPTTRFISLQNDVNTNYEDDTRSVSTYSEPQKYQSTAFNSTVGRITDIAGTVALPSNLTNIINTNNPAFTPGRVDRIFGND